jgi:DNA repair protein RadC
VFGINPQGYPHGSIYSASCLPVSIAGLMTHQQSTFHLNRVKAMKKPAPQVAEIELVYRHWVPAIQRPKITSAADAYGVLRSLWNEDTICLREQFHVLLLDRANRVMGHSLISSGGTAGTVADPKLIFVTALKCKAAAILLAHNHPSQNLTPSQADIQLTRHLKQAGQWLELPVLDHLIVTADSYFSFAEEGIL